MRTDGIFDYRVVQLGTQYNKPINIIFLGDEHFNSPGFAAQKWKQDMAELKELCRKETVYFIKTGDTFEALSTSERKHFSNGFHDTTETRWEKEYAREVKNYVDQVPFLIGRTLGVFGGNHFFKFYDGTTSDMVLARELGAPYIGVSGYIILSFTVDGCKSHVLKIFVHHGRSSGRKAGSTFNSLEDAACYFSDASIIVCGHDHKAGAMQLPSICCKHGKNQNYRIAEIDRIIGRSGSYLKSYEPGVASYAVDSMMRPSTLGYLRIIATLKRTTHREGNQDFSDFQLRAVI